MIRYYKFERVNGDTDRGDVLMDMSYWREHCAILEANVWVKEDILGTSLALFLNELFKSPDYAKDENSHLVFEGNGPTLNAPRRASDFDEGFTIEFWAYFKTLPTGTFSIKLFELTNADGTASLSIDDTWTSIQSDFFTV